ncbi:hypothetical protein Dimus_023562 [Dionaea muscipula]
MLAGAAMKRRIEEIRPKLGSTKRTNRVLGQPRIGTVQVKAVVATRDQTDRLLGPYLIQADRALRSRYQFLPARPRQLLQLYTQMTELVIRSVHAAAAGCTAEAAGAPQQAEVYTKHHAHPDAGKEKGHQHLQQHIK